MVYDVSHLRLTFGGPLFLSETWSCGLRIASVEGAATGPLPQADAVQFCLDRITEVTDKVIAYWVALSNATNPAAKLTWVKLNPIQTSGLQYPDTDTVVQTFAPPTAGSVQTQFPQIALAVSLMTGLARGRAHTGRFYLPAGGSIGVDGSGNISTLLALAVADATSDFINALNDWSGVDPLWGANVHVMSNLDTGRRRKVTSVRVGRTIDTQRRRRSSIPELYEASSVTIA